MFSRKHLETFMEKKRPLQASQQEPKWTTKRNSLVRQIEAIKKKHQSK